MSRGTVACAIAIACISFSEIARAGTDDNGTYWATAPEQEAPAPARHERIEYTPTHAPPFEPPAARFGARGQLVMTGNTTLALSYTTYSDSDASAFSASFAPALDYFVVKNLAIGLRLNVGYGDSRGYGADSSLVDTKSSSVLVGPRVSYNVPLGRFVSWYPSVSFAAGYTQRKETLVSGSSLSIAGSAVGAPSTSEADAQVNIDASIYFHPRSHVLFGIGPSFSHDFARVQGGPDVGAQVTTIGGGITVGGYWGGDRNGSQDDESAPPRRSLRSFGDAHEIVFTNEVLTQGYWTTHAGIGSTSGNLQFLLAADYFVIPHLSIGGAVSASYALTKGIDAATQLPVTYQSDSYGAALRLGCQIPLFDTVSLYPRVSFGGGEQDSDEFSGLEENAHSNGYFNVSAYAPLVVEIAPHFFAGFGPSFSHDLSRSDQYGYNNRATIVGAGAELGVWL
jgi:hypothetical protein